MAETILVTCLANSGYRRAGIEFDKGENHLPAAQLSQAQLAAIEGDHRLAVAPADPQGSLAENRLGDGLDGSVALGLERVALEGIDPELAPFVAAIDHLARRGELAEGKKPRVDQLTVEAEDDSGAAVSVKPSADQRDRAWAHYLRLVQQPQQPEP